MAVQLVVCHLGRCCAVLRAGQTREEIRERVWVRFGHHGGGTQEATIALALMSYVSPRAVQS